MKNPATALLTIGLLLAACSGSEQSDQTIPSARPAVQQWAKGLLQPHEKLLCTATHAGDYFYVSRVSPHTLWVGSQLAIELTKPASASSILEQWSFRSPNGVSLITEKMPRNIRTTDPTADSPFVESITEYILEDSGSTVSVGVTVKRCPSADCSMGTKQVDAEQYRTDVCAIELTKLERVKQ